MSVPVSTPGPRRVLLMESNEDQTVGGSYQALFDLARLLDRRQFEPARERLGRPRSSASRASRSSAMFQETSRSTVWFWARGERYGALASARRTRGHRYRSSVAMNRRDDASRILPLSVEDVEEMGRW
jgi:hypothetical protein